MSHLFRNLPVTPLALLLMSLAVLAVYWPGVEGGFVFDDLPNIVNNADLHVRTLAWDDWMSAALSSQASTLQRPLAMLSLAVNHFFTGLDPRPMKLTNISIHVLNALLAYGMLRAVIEARSLPGQPGPTRRQGTALFAVFAWALHPINLMAVLFIVQRMESLSHVFVFVGLWLYVDGRRRQLDGRAGGWIRILAGLFACTPLGLLAKESAVLLPLYAFCVELCLLRFAVTDQRDRRRLRWMFALGLWLPALLTTAWLLQLALEPGAYANRNFDMVERLLTESRVVLQYLGWSLYPDLGQLGLYHDDYPVSRSLFDPPATALAIVALAAVLAGALWLRARRPVAALGLFWFLAAQALTATFIPLELMFEHRNYFASIGICLALADLLLLWPGTAGLRKAGLLVAALIALLFAGGTALRAHEWVHPIRFVQSEVAKHPGSPRATYELARMLVILSEYRADSPYLEPAMAAIEAARAVPGSGVLPEQAGLIFAARTGRPLREEWWRGLQWKLRHQPMGHQPIGAIGAMIDCSNLRLCRFPPARMLETIAAAMSQGDHPELFNLYGSYALNSLGDSRLALALWREAVRTRPSEPQYRVNLTRLLIALGHVDEARAEIASLRRTGRLGQFESRALRLEAELAEKLDGASKAGQ